MSDEQKSDPKKVIHLPNNPLAEAWLELQWRTADVAGVAATTSPIDEVDTDFQFALGVFYNLIRNEYREQESLVPREISPYLIPHRVAYRFRQSKTGWPLLQLGPGIATVNYTKEYTWNSFRNEALYLRENLLAAYGNSRIVLTEMVLRYRDLFDLDFRDSDVKTYLGEHLHIHISWPDAIPGRVASSPFPASVGLNLGFDLLAPRAAGSIRLTTATQSLEDGVQRPIVLTDIEMRAKDVTPELLTDEKRFEGWLEQSHDVVHDWFFSLIDGKLLEEFQGAKQ